MVAQPVTPDTTPLYLVRSLATGLALGPAYANRGDACRRAALDLATHPAGFEIVREEGGLQCVVAVVRPTAAG